MLLKIGIIFLTIISAIKGDDYLISQLKQIKPSQTTLDLSWKRINNLDEIVEIGNALKANKQITTLKLYDSLDPSSNDLQLALLSSLLKNTEVTNLIVSKSQLTSWSLNILQTELVYTKIDRLDLSLDQTFGTEGMINFIKFLKHSNITELNLDNTVINDEVIKTLTDELKDTKLRKINLSHNRLSSSDVVIPLIQKLEEFNIDYSLNYNQDLKDDAIALIIDASIRKNKTELNLSGFDMKLNHYITVARGLFMNPNVESLALTHSTDEFNDLSILSSVLKYTKIHTLKIESPIFNKIDKLKVVRDQLISDSPINFVELDVDGFLAADLDAIVNLFNLVNYNQLILRLRRPFTEQIGTDIADRLLKTRINNLTLDIISVTVGDGEMSALKQIIEKSNIFALKITHARSIDSKFIDTLLQLLSSKPSIKHLSLDDDFIDMDGFTAISAAIGNLNSLSSLNLDNNNWGYKNLKSLMESLVLSNVMTLSLNNIISLGTFDTQSLVNNLGSTIISSISLTGNKLSASDIQKIAKVLPNSRIEELYLNNNDIKGEGAKALADVLDRTGVMILNLENNNIDNDGAKSIADVLCQSKVVNLNIDGNAAITDGKVLEKIDSCLKSNRVKLDYKLSKGVQLSKLNRIYFNYESYRTQNSLIMESFKVFVDIIKKLNVTDISMESLLSSNVVTLDSDALKEITSVSKVFYYPTVSDHWPEKNAILKKNRISFAQAQEVITNFKTNKTETCSDTDFNSFELFETTIDLWQHEQRESVDYLRKAIKSEISRIRMDRKVNKQIEKEVKSLPNIFAFLFSWFKLNHLF